MVTKGESILTADARDMQLQIRQWVRTYEKYWELLEDEKKRFLEYAAEPLVEELRMRSPVGSKIHVRYMSREKKSRPGFGIIRKKYYPGNLKSSFGIIDLRRTAAVIVGARVDKKNGRTRMKGGRFGVKRWGDGYYLHMVEYGTRYSAAQPFVRPAIIAATPRIVRTIKNELQLLARRFGQRYGVNTVLSRPSTGF